MAKITVNLPNTRKGAPVNIPNVGTFENGKEHETDRVDEDKVYGVPLGEESPAEKARKARHDELYKQAQDLDIQGRTKMTDDELEAAIAKAEADDNDDEGDE